MGVPATAVVRSSWRRPGRAHLVVLSGPRRLGANHVMAVGNLCPNARSRRLRARRRWRTRCIFRISPASKSMIVSPTHARKSSCSGVQVVGMVHLRGQRDYRAGELPPLHLWKIATSAGTIPANFDLGPASGAERHPSIMPGWRLDRKGARIGRSRQEEHGRRQPRSPWRVTAGRGLATCAISNEGVIGTRFLAVEAFRKRHRKKLRRRLRVPLRGRRRIVDLPIFLRGVCWRVS